MTATSPSTSSISTCSTLTRVDKDDGQNVCKSSVGKVTAEEEDFDEVLRRITNDEQYGGNGGYSDVDGDEYDIHRDCIVSESDESNSVHDDMNANDTKGKSIGCVDLTKRRKCAICWESAYG